MAWELDLDDRARGRAGGAAQGTADRQRGQRRPPPVRCAPTQADPGVRRRAQEPRGPVEVDDPASDELPEVGLGALGAPHPLEHALGGIDETGPVDDLP